MSENGEITGLIEDIALSMGRLDARLSASPLQEFWQVRASLAAAVKLAQVDGDGSTIFDLSAFIMGASLLHPESYRPAGIAFGHWARMLARVELTPTANQLLGRSVSRSQQAAEDQAWWDAEDRWPSGLIRPTSVEDDLSWEDLAKQSSDRCLQAMAGDVERPLLLGLAVELQRALRTVGDVGYYERIYQVRRSIEMEVDMAWGEAPPLPSGSSRADEIKALIDWSPRGQRGACFSVIPDWLKLHGMTVSRLSCLTGATKRLAFEGKLDARAKTGFLRRLRQDIIDGLTLLNRLEADLARVAGNLGTLDPRSSLADVAYAFFLLPACDTGWISTTLGLSDRVARKLVKRLADEGIVQPFAKRRAHAIDKEAISEFQLWCLPGYNDPHITPPSPPLFNKKALAMDSSSAIGRVLLDRFEPMQEVFRRWDDQMIELDEAFGQFWPGKLSKTRPPETGLTARK